MKGTKIASVAHKKLVTETMKKRKAEADLKKKEKATKTAGAPKRPPTAFFIFMADFRKSYKENFPDNKSVAVVGKAGGEKWKAMSESEKAPYVGKAAKLKAEYEKTKSVTGEAAKSEDSEVHDDAEQQASS
ncbi:PREDICTED: HMG1/2-like protein isoform X2 [Nicotiana attenuata]|uniref:HMG1/2-like protein isoform X2 n=1 Tax=Nicotiana attenuata TaxID=49451 RepID=UPI00090487E2|nr:PREDICTED: HMG1/2-like protein isoform X2 [Nicotiana attenuata]